MRKLAASWCSCRARSRTPWLTLDQQVRIVAVASLVTGAARLLAEDPGTVIITGELARVWDLVDHAIA